MKIRRRALKIFAAICGLLLSLVLAGFWVRGPIGGFWDHPLNACMCDSKNLVEFRDGRAYISSGHEEMRGEAGRYYKENGVWIWENGTPENLSKIRLYPTWFLLKAVSDDLEGPLTGHRIIWPPAVSEARANLKPIASKVTE
jgi:hypothetical protein